MNDLLILSEDKTTLWGVKDRGVKEIFIPNSVIMIKDEAFKDCILLQNIYIPNSVTHIGCQAFWNCSSLKSIVIPNSVTSINSWAFCGCSSLVFRSVEQPKTIRNIQT